MKKRLAFLLGLVLCLGLFGGIHAMPVLAEEQETVPQGLEGEIRFTVSALDLSLVGDREDIYAGSLPREAVTWQTGNPKVVTFENGVLTATGVGATTVSASYEGRKAEIPVSCLAQDADALLQLPPEVLLAPKRLPAQPKTDSADAFRNSALVGDSISYVLFQNQKDAHGLGDMTFLTRSGVTLRSLNEHYLELRYGGQDGHIEDLIRQAKVKKVFLLLGQADLNTMSIQDTLKQLDTLLEKIQEASPQVEIYLQSCLPEYSDGLETLPKNLRLRDYNRQLRSYAETNGCHYVELGAFGENHVGNLAEPYHGDSIHPNAAGCEAWVQVLKSAMEAEN